MNWMKFPDLYISIVCPLFYPIKFNLFLVMSEQDGVLEEGQLRRQCGRVVSMLDLQSGSTGFESRSGHLLDLFLVVRVQILGHACK